MPISRVNSSHPQARARPGAQPCPAGLFNPGIGQRAGHQIGDQHQLLVFAPARTGLRRENANPRQVGYHNHIRMQSCFQIEGNVLLTIVMLPGMDGTGDLFAPIITELGSVMSAIVVRYPDAPLGYEALIAHARQALPAAGDFFLLGESFSGPIAVALAADGNPRLRGLILSAAFIRNPLPWTSPIAPLVEVAPVTGAPASLLTRALLGQFSTPARRAMICASLAQKSRTTIRARLRAIAEIDMRDRLATVNVPILYLRASHDRIVPESAGDLVMLIKPETTLVTVQAPHFLLQVGFREAARAIRAFMAKTSRRS